MKFKNNFKRFFTLDRHHDAGFTLVELIVVIAILAILAGVAVPAYSGYIAKANEAADIQLVGAVNTAFAAACLENGYAANKVTGAEITVSGEKKVTGVSKVAVETASLSAGAATATTLTDEQVAVISASFMNFFGENANTVFKVYDALSFDPATHTFEGVDLDAGDGAAANTGVFGQIISGLGESIKQSVSDFKESVFNDIGSDALLQQVTGVTDYSHYLAFEQGNANYQAFLAQNAADLATVMGYDINDKDPESEKGWVAFQAVYEAMVAEKAANNGITDPLQADSSARFEILSNYAVLSAAQGLEGKEASDLMDDLREGMDADELKAMMKSTNPEESREGLSKAAMLYGMYTAWANGLPDDYVDEDGNTKEDALANASNVNSFMGSGMLSEDFQTYLEDPNSSATTDLAGYLGAMDIINKSIEGDTDNQAITQLLMNGFSDEALGNAVKDALK